MKRMANKLPPIHPGEILREEFMLPRGLSQNALGRALNVPPRRINEIVLEKRGITADTALRLARLEKPRRKCFQAARRAIKPARARISGIIASGKHSRNPWNC